MSPETKEGYEAYFSGKAKSANPYNWSNETWWQVEAWEDGWKKAQDEDHDDD